MLTATSYDWQAHMPAKKFQRTIENFTCKKCGYAVTGNGYTNHCPQCLYGKHVDINPGDRLEDCLGLMEPIAIEVKNDKYIITHRCAKCNKEKKNKASINDNFDTIISLSSRDQK